MGQFERYFRIVGPCHVTRSLPMATYNLKYFKRASIYRPYRISYPRNCSRNAREEREKEIEEKILSLSFAGMKIKREKKKSKGEGEGAVVDDFDKSSREQRVNVGWHFKSVARVSAHSEFFKRSERAREREKEGWSFNWRREVREGGTKATRATFSTYKK